MGSRAEKFGDEAIGEWLKKKKVVPLAEARDIFSYAKQFPLVSKFPKSAAAAKAALVNPDGDKDALFGVVDAIRIVYLDSQSFPRVDNRLEVRGPRDGRLLLIHVDDFASNFSRFDVLEGNIVIQASSTESTYLEVRGEANVILITGGNTQAWVDVYDSGIAQIVPSEESFVCLNAQSPNSWVLPDNLDSLPRMQVKKYE